MFAKKTRNYGLAMQVREGTIVTERRSLSAEQAAEPLVSAAESNFRADRAKRPVVRGMWSSSLPEISNGETRVGIYPSPSDL